MYAGLTTQTDGGNNMYSNQGEGAACLESSNGVREVKKT